MPVDRTSPPLTKYSPEELEELKRENDRRAREEHLTRPDHVRAWPQYMTIMNTDKCNLHCPMCFKQLDDVHNMSLPDVDWSLFEKVAAECFPHLRLINLSVSGEPLVSRSIFRELELLRHYAVQTDITTNGMPLGRRGLLEALVPVCHSLTISFDAATKETFEYVRMGAKFDTVIQNLRLFNEMRLALPESSRPGLQMNHIYQHANARELVLLVELAKDLGVDFLNVEHVYVHRDDQKWTSMVNHPSLANDMIKQARERAEEVGLDAQFPSLYDNHQLSSGEPYQPPTKEWLLQEASKPLDLKQYGDAAPPPGQWH